MTLFKSSSCHNNYSALNTIAAANNLIDLTSAPLSPAVTASRSTSSESRPAGTMTENKQRQVSSDSFAGLTGLIKSKKTWTIPTKPVAPIANGQSKPTSLSESMFSAPTDARNYSSLRATSTSAAASRQVHHRAPEIHSHLDTLTSIEATSVNDQQYDKDVMSKMEDLIAEMSKIDTEAPSERDIVPTRTVGVQHQPQAQSPSQTLVNIDAASSSPVDGLTSPPRSGTPAFDFRTPNDELTSRSKDSESTFHPQVNQSVVRCTTQVWDTMINQMTTLKKEKMEAQAKVASLERDWSQSHPSKGDDSTELDQLRYRLQVNKEHKAVMHREIRQKDVELHNKDLEIESQKKQIADLVYMRERWDKLQAEADYMRIEAEKVEADNGQLKQIVILKEQENRELKELLTHTKAKMTNHQQRAENLVDTQNTRETKLKQLEKQLRDAQDTEEKLLDENELLKTDIEPLKKQAKDLNSLLHDKTSSCDRMRNDLKHTEKRLEMTAKALHKVENHQHLRGAAHLIIPSDQTKLPKLVLPCIECFARNVPCDTNSRCQTCSLNNEKCHRWRCSQVHILRGGCQDFMCPLEHDINGWLMLKQERPQW